MRVERVVVRFTTQRMMLSTPQTTLRFDDKPWQKSTQPNAHHQAQDHEGDVSDDPRSPAVRERQLRRHLPGGVGGDGGGQSWPRAGLWRRSLDAPPLPPVPATF